VIMELNRIYQGDWIEVMKSWPDEFVQSVITSPPYFGLRDYGVDGQLGLEETPEEYIEKMVAGFREVRRVLRKDGTVWLNLGDSYWGGGNNRGNNSPISDKQASNAGAVGQCANHQKNTGHHPIIKPKDLCMMPARIALALQADGWYLRSDIIWDKPNPMPESVRDRPTKSHEYIFLLTKSARYYYDQEAVRESRADTKHTRSRYKYKPSPGSGRSDGLSCPTNIAGKYFNIGDGCRNLRSVWHIPTQPCSFAHFATFPEKLVNRCILAGTSEMACGICGKPFKRVVKKGESYWQKRKELVDDLPMRAGDVDGGRSSLPGDKLNGKILDEWKRNHPDKDLGFWPDCEHDYFPIMDSTGKCIVLDPFCGTNTVGYRAQEMGRQWLGIELNDKYIAYGINRAAQEVIL